MRKILPILAVACFTFIGLAHADDSDDALRDTQKLLNDPALRAADAKTSADSAAAQQRILELVKKTGASEKDIYSLSSSVFADIVKKANGDPAAILKLLEDAEKNPEAFAKSWKAEDQAKLREIASQSNKK